MQLQLEILYHHLKKDFSYISKFIPKSTFDFIERFYKDKSYSIPTLKSFEKEIIYILKRMTLEEIRNLPDISEGLEYKIKEVTTKSFH